jgi:predicted nuclease of predicted toxin-antitoxin system
MRFLADENLELSIVEELRLAGHDVATVPGEAAGTRDRLVLSRSVDESRILITNDKDFAELVFLQRSLTVGIILVRLPRSGSREKARRVAEVVEEQGHRLRGAMTVIEEDASRRRAIPLHRGAKGPDRSDRGTQGGG